MSVYGRWVSFIKLWILLKYKNQDIINEKLTTGLEVNKQHDYGYRDRRGNANSSTLTANGIAMNDKKKRLIQESLRYPIIDIVTFQGYKGDAVIKITTLNEEATVAIETIGKHLGFEVNTIVDQLMVRKIHCAVKNNVYKLKRKR